MSVHRGVLNRKAKSFEEREEEYEKVKRRIFRNNRELYAQESLEDQEWSWVPHHERHEPVSKLKVPNHRLLKIHSNVSNNFEQIHPNSF